MLCETCRDGQDYLKKNTHQFIKKMLLKSLEVKWGEIDPSLP